MIKYIGKSGGINNTSLKNNMLKTMDDIEKEILKQKYVGDSGEDVLAKNSLKKSKTDFANEEQERGSDSPSPPPDYYKELKEKLERLIRNLGRSNLLNKEKVKEIIQEVEDDKKTNIQKLLQKNT